MDGHGHRSHPNIHRPTVSASTNTSSSSALDLSASPAGIATSLPPSPSLDPLDSSKNTNTLARRRLGGSSRPINEAEHGQDPLGLPPSTFTGLGGNQDTQNPFISPAEHYHHQQHRAAAPGTTGRDHHHDSTSFSPLPGPRHYATPHHAHAHSGPASSHRDRDSNDYPIMEHYDYTSSLARPSTISLISHSQPLGGEGGGGSELRPEYHPYAREGFGGDDDDGLGFTDNTNTSRLNASRSAFRGTTGSWKDDDDGGTARSSKDLHPVAETGHMGANVNVPSSLTTSHAASASVSSSLHHLQDNQEHTHQQQQQHQRRRTTLRYSTSPSPLKKTGTAIKSMSQNLRRVSLRVVNLANSGLETQIRLPDDDHYGYNDPRYAGARKSSDDEDETGGYGYGANGQGLPDLSKTLPLRGRTLGCMGPRNQIRLGFYRLLVYP